MSVELNESHILTKASTKDNWDLRSLEEDHPEILVETNHPVFGDSMMGLALKGPHKVGGRPSGYSYAPTSAASNVCFFVGPAGFETLLLKMYQADRQATLRAIANTILHEAQ